MSHRDSAMHIKSIMKFRKNELKAKKIRRVLVSVTLIVGMIALYAYVYAKDTVNLYITKSEGLAEDLQELENNKQLLGEQIEDIEKQKEEIKSEQERLLSEAELVAQNNQSIIEENMRLQDSLKMAASVGITPINYGVADETDSAVDYSKLEYIGEFEGTAYTPSADECSNNLGLTASGKPIVAGVSIAVDTKYWKLGTKFYIEGLGYVIAMDTGNAVKGKYRFDYAVFDKSFAKKLRTQKLESIFGK